MKLIKSKGQLLLGVFPIMLVAYGWYLGQLHQSMQDLAGILMFITGLAGFLLALGLRVAMRCLAWRDTWWSYLLTGLVGCVLVFLVLVLYAQIHG